MSYKWVKRIARGMLPCFVFFVFSFSFAPKAHAVEFEGKLSWGFQTTGTWAMFAQTTTALPVVNGTLRNDQASVNTGNDFGIRMVTLPDQTFKSVVKLYASYYFTTPYGNARSKSANFYNPASFNVTYINQNGQTGVVEGGLASFEPFTPTSSSAIGGEGYAIEAEWQGSEAMPIRSLQIQRKTGEGFIATAGDTLPVLACPSIRIITTEYTAEMEALDAVADAIAAQSEVLLAMKGEMVAILQDIYQMTGDMYAAQNLLNTYISELLPLLERIDQNTINIYSLLSTQLRALETAINGAATTIEAAIAAQTAAMIAFLEEVLNTGNEVPDDTYQMQEDAANILDQMGALQKPDVNTVVPEIGDYTDGGVSGVLGAIFSSNLIVTMMTLSASFAFGAYVLFGKRE